MGEDLKLSLGTIVLKELNCIILKELRVFQIRSQHCHPERGFFFKIQVESCHYCPQRVREYCPERGWFFFFFF